MIAFCWKRVGGKCIRREMYKERVEALGKEKVSEMIKELNFLLRKFSSFI